MVVGRRFTRKKKNTWHILRDYKVIHLQEKNSKNSVFYSFFRACVTSQTRWACWHLYISPFLHLQVQNPEMISSEWFMRGKRSRCCHIKTWNRRLFGIFLHCFGRKKWLKRIILIIRIVACDIYSLYLPYKKISFGQQNLVSHLSSFTRWLVLFHLSSFLLQSYI